MENMEVLEITPDWGVELETPRCELHLDDDCETFCTHGIRVHDCGFHYCCEECAKQFAHRVRGGFRDFKKMRCAECKRGFTNNKKYYQIIKL
jgi:hypothetical protein